MVDRAGRAASFLVRRLTREGDPSGRQPDRLLVEEPLLLRLNDHDLTTTMRTPGHDFELAVGFCHAEGLLDGVPVQTCRYCGTGSALDTEFNVVDVETGGRARVPQPRLTVSTSSCGLCGAADVDALTERLHPLPETSPFAADVLASVPDRVRVEQSLFDRTGAVHAAAAFEPDGRPSLVREDVGRHNAVDKVVGRMLLDGRLPATGLGLYVSGRASFEMVQKAWAAGFSTLVAVSAPTALAVDAARRAGLVLAGFVRDDGFNVYAPERLDRDGSGHAGTRTDP